MAKLPQDPVRVVSFPRGWDPWWAPPVANFMLVLIVLGVFGSLAGLVFLPEAVVLSIRGARRRLAK